MSLRAAKSTREILKLLSNGPGASKLPSNVSKIQLTFASKGKNESAGARQFLKESLPRIRYNNPTVEYEVYKKADPTTKPTISIHFTNGGLRTIEIPRTYSETVVDQVFNAAP